MNYPKRFLSLTTAMALASLAATAVPAAETTELPFASELDACVAEVNANLDLAGVTRLRHTVTKEKRTGIGYVLNIETAVYSPHEQRSFSTYCVARGAANPVKFEMTEVR